MRHVRGIAHSACGCENRGHTQVVGVCQGWVEARPHDCTRAQAKLSFFAQQHGKVAAKNILVNREGAGACVCVCVCVCVVVVGARGACDWRDL